MTVAIKKRKLVVSLEYDENCENPVESAGWKVVSFGRRHANFKHPGSYFAGVQNGEPYGVERGLANKLRAGTAFWLGYYEHGLCQWALQGEQHQCRWDSVNVAGLLIFDGKPKDVGKNREERTKYARSVIEEYTAFCNGHVYCFAVEDEDGEILDSCGGFFDAEGMMQEIRREFKDDELEFVGDASGIACYH